jgi:hypothetical protein
MATKPARELAREVAALDAVLADWNLDTRYLLGPGHAELARIGIRAAARLDERLTVTAIENDTETGWLRITAAGNTDAQEQLRQSERESRAVCSICADPAVGIFPLPGFGSLTLCGRHSPDGVAMAIRSWAAARRANDAAGPYLDVIAETAWPRLLTQRHSRMANVPLALLRRALDNGDLYLEEHSALVEAVRHAVERLRHVLLDAERGR